MSITLPNAATATTDSTASITAATTAAQNAFVASATVLINEAIANGLYQVEPFLPSLVTSAFVTSYFGPLGYTVVYPIIPPGPFENLVLQPEVIPPGWSHNAIPQAGPARIKIFWPST